MQLQHKMHRSRKAAQCYSTTEAVQNDYVAQREFSTLQLQLTHNSHCTATGAQHTEWLACNWSGLPDMWACRLGRAAWRLQQSCQLWRGRPSWRLCCLLCCLIGAALLRLHVGYDMT